MFWQWNTIRLLQNKIINGVEIGEKYVELYILEKYLTIDNVKSLIKSEMSKSKHISQKTI